ncbi:50S ribosomal protein L7/L12 domain protein [Ancylostoma caninum]|uniref:50S ribosomal protein L7/L12 domain protein n=1 Tax=Ancylostoma caninum TaxID=29170 RepID=A0A368FG22_ANCCA|nr:50S ribosomal protein L7/L12 domain protein [Ancylostoma caninum]
MLSNNDCESFNYFMLGLTVGAIGVDCKLSIGSFIKFAKKTCGQARAKQAVATGAHAVPSAAFAAISDYCTDVELASALEYGDKFVPVEEVKEMIGEG